MIAALTAGLLAGYGVALPVGAIGAYLVALTARTSLRTGAFAALGVATADGVYALVAVCGGVALAPALRPVTQPLRLASAVVLFGLAARGTALALRRYRERSDGTTASGLTSSSAVKAYLALWGMTMLNPLTIVYFTALVLGRPAAAAPGRVDAAAFVLAVFCASASWQLVLAGGGAFLGRVLTGPRGRLATGLASSVLVGALAARLLLAAATTAGR
jgi:arginine exporter protein ArgO